jgi:cytosine/adenosine deaminase-related metal-dependent hydrolase
MADQIHSQQLNSSHPVIHRGPWIVRGVSSEPSGFEQKPLEDGALIVADGLIQAIGRYRDIKKEFGQYHIQDHEGKVLVPALINGHCHLELSHLDFPNHVLDQKSYNGDITCWIGDLLSERERFYRENADAEKLILHHAKQALQHMSAEGVAFIGDVGNLLSSRTIGEDQNTRICFLLELLGLTKESELKTFARFENVTADDFLDIVCTPHAPYSTTPALIKAMKMQADRQKHIVSIHVAESMQEVEFLQSGTGAFKEFLLAREAWDGSFTIPAKASVEYLDSLGVLDNKTICVHGVHVDNGEIKILSKKNVKVCLCPGSNRFLGVGKAPVTEFLDHGILPALGTDSKASNLKLSMWREMRLLREDHPGLSPESVFAMATRGGAEAWEVASEMGSLESGKHSLILAVSNNGNIDSPGEIFDFLTSAGESVQKEWLG